MRVQSETVEDRYQKAYKLISEKEVNMYSGKEFAALGDGVPHYLARGLIQNMYDMKFNL